ncbi:BZ3500_MvSof-1268-A1-R1_Chr8-2g10235 [Microbotryum saponariae]|uniref:BZ3500_MvSof-1268-A1-R1_Chr8-2g10235 protein n=1 Tax=Microbotryum saponariae TaxID=289078 RepID=A0A2X0KXA3_9BASI|nr:BZ3500_MvSof-1268-A1-R1_Chr8-2g10235 [Microbotryum saponariae]SDA02033.1 BZ3501_MvSof-1269-A2-R1_Chr8-2g09985 [Microbotryum saponariae]
MLSNDDDDACQPFDDSNPTVEFIQSPVHALDASLLSTEPASRHVPDPDGLTDESKHRTQAKRMSPDPWTPRSWATMFVRQQRPFPGSRPCRRGNRKRRL